MAETVSQRVNALFASYVATEAEQTRLADLGTPEAGKEADALGPVAIAIRDQVFAIRERSACPDLIAARILMDLMLSHPWPPTPRTEWGDAADLELPMLEILSGALTGEVLRQASVALATIGVDVPAEEPSSIEAMTRELHGFFLRNTAGMSEAEADASCEEFAALQERIIRAEPITARDVALQFMADTFFCTTDNSDEFPERLKSLAGFWAPFEPNLDEDARRYVDGEIEKEAV